MLVNQATLGFILVEGTVRTFLRIARIKKLITTAAITTSRITLAAEHANILFIFSDDHALEAISAYGDRFDEVATTPNIDCIAKVNGIGR